MGVGWECWEQRIGVWRWEVGGRIRGTAASLLIRTNLQERSAALNTWTPPSDGRRCLGMTEKAGVCCEKEQFLQPVAVELLYPRLRRHEDLQIECLHPRRQVLTCQEQSENVADALRADRRFSCLTASR